MESCYNVCYLDFHNHSPHQEYNNSCTNFNRREVLVSKKVTFEGFFAWPLIFLQAKDMQNNFREFEELVFFDLWIPDSGFRIPDSGFRIPDSGFWFPVSGFRIPVLGLPGQVTIQNWVGKSVGREGLLSVLFVAVTNLVGPCGSVAKNYTLYRRILLMLKYRRLVQREIRKQNGAHTF